MSSLNALAQLPVGSRDGRRREAAPAERGCGLKRVLGEKSDRFMDIAFGQFGRRADKVHGHADSRAASEIGTECDVLFSGNAETVVEQADGAGGTDGGHYRGNGGPDRLNDNIAQTAADLPWIALDPRDVVVGSAMEQAFEILKGLERHFHRNWNRDRVLDARQHARPPHVAEIMRRFRGEDKAEL